MKEIDKKKTEQVEYDLTQLNYQTQKSLSELLGLLMNLNHIDRQSNLKTYQLYLRKVVSISETLHNELDRLTKKINVELLQTNDQIHDQVIVPVPPITLQDISANFIQQLTEG